MERACARAEHFGPADYPTLRRILQQGLDHEPWETPPPAPPPSTGMGDHGAVLPASGPRAYRFVRQAGELVAGLLGGVR